MATAELARDLAMALDPVELVRRAGIEPDPWQAGVLRSTASRQLLNCCRQAGKSTITAGLALHTALYAPESLILLLSPGERQSKELLRKVIAQYEALDRPVAADAENTLTLELENGSRIVALPGNEATICGYSGVALLIVDEASRVPDTLYASVRPMLAVSGGRLLALSTPFGKRGWWFTAWEEGEHWQRTKITAHQCPRITPAFLEEEQRALPASWFKAEYLCEFGELEGAVFGYDDIQAALSGEVLPLWSTPAAIEEEDACLPLFVG